MVALLDMFVIKKNEGVGCVDWLMPNQAIMEHGDPLDRGPRPGRDPSRFARSHLREYKVILTR